MHWLLAFSMALSPGQIVAKLAPIVGRVGAAGIAGNLMQESSDDPARAGGGLAQWQGSRYTGLVRYAQSRGLSPSSADAALGYLAQDLRGPYSGLASQLRGAKNPAHAATLFSTIYERPGTPMLGNRINYARQALGAAPGGRGAFPAGPGMAAQQAGSQAFSTQVPTFDQAGFQKATNAYVAGNFLSHQDGPYDVGGTGSNPLFASGLLTTSAPNPQAFQGTRTRTVHLTAATGALQRMAGGTQLHPHPEITRMAAGKLPKGLSQFGGKPVAAWIAPILAYAQKHGWRGSVTSGYRTLAQQTQIYNSGVRPAARPGTSNHEMTAFPGGAVDVSQAQQLSRILARSPYASLLVYAGSKDPVHFSHPHNGSY